ncbi:chromosome segregation ATPase [Janibacter sp. Soil728]|nr:chromosome segregation ATPase [Janibacter sp. Soil728]
MFGVRKHAQQVLASLDNANEEIARLKSELDRLGALEVADLERQREALKVEIREMRDQLVRETATLQAELDDLRSRVVKTQEAEILQEVGLYDYRHPLSDSVTYKDELAKLKDQIKALARQDGGAIETAQGWTVNGSEAQGKKMLRDYSKLMLRAYNAEADNLVRGMKPYKLASAVERLNKVTATIERLGKTMSIRVTGHYHQLRIREMELTADYQEMLAREKEKEREEKERLREQRKVELEIAREKARLDKERQHYSNALQALIEKGDSEGAGRLRAQLDEIDRAMEEVDYRAANVRAGYVYVISNVGALGARMIKVGMTRRLDPMDRVRELSDASVPFNFDVHAMFFSEDAYGIEAEMHRRLAVTRVNRVNLRREFFYATPSEARDLLMELTGELLQFNEEPEALEYHQSLQVVQGEQPRPLVV